MTAAVKKVVTKRPDGKVVRYCPHCKFSYFSRKKSARETCPMCGKLNIRTYAPTHIIDGVPYKPCPICKTLIVYDPKDPMKMRCIPCQKKYSKEYKAKEKKRMEELDANR